MGKFARRGWPHLVLIRCRTICALVVGLLCFGSLIVLGGCETSPAERRFQRAHHRSSSDSGTKTESFDLIVPAEIHDPIGVGEVIVEELSGHGFEARRAYAAETETPENREAPIRSSVGSGFFVSPDGYLLTNAHVVTGSADVVVVLQSGKEVVADVIRSDPTNDVALLKAEHAPSNWMPLASGRTSSGDAIRVIGFPLSSILGSEPRVNDGIIAATAGIDDDPTRMQITAGIHSGNSGGPVVDEEGRVVAIATEKLSDAFLVEQTGEIPQNINFAVKSSYAEPLLPVEVREAHRERAISDEQIEFEDAVAATVLIRSDPRAADAGELSDEEVAQVETLLVLFEYTYAYDVFHYTLTRLDIRFVEPDSGTVVASARTSGPSLRSYDRITRDVVAEALRDL